MERIINLHIEKLPEGVYLATSDDIQGLVAKMEREGGLVSLPAVSDKFDYTLVIGT
ncbi:MAG: DUF1902 domain-containing protein [Deltaproteobacteria bacterium]|nr:DUF1902 domain-containing protein [Deltaproteobacteria bacterium]